MTLTKTDARGPVTTRSLLHSLIDTPDLARTIEQLPVRTFAALIRNVGVEDAGELVALATTEQLVQAFDEDLFVSERAGERETLDMSRFAVWLEVLLEAGDEVAANRVAELDEDFVAHALSGIVRVLDEDALRQRLEEGDEDESRCVDKALESALTEDLDGYLLVAKHHDGWDAALLLIVALDRDHRPLLVRLLDRMALVDGSALDDLDELATLLTEGESLADDVEAAREERRSKQGYVEPCAARGFLALARKPLTPEDHAAAARDPLTRAYFRELERHPQPAPSGRRSASPAGSRGLPPAVQRALDESSEQGGGALAASSTPASAMSAFMDALRELSEAEPHLFGERMDELAYLANVLVAAQEHDGARLTPKAATEATLATVCFGAIVELRAAISSGVPQNALRRSPSEEWARLVRARSADALFRAASGVLASGAALHVPASEKSGLLYSADELDAALR